MRSACEACGGRSLEPHLRVAGERENPELIPTTLEFGSALADIVRCRACGHMQLERLPAAADLARAYADAESLDYVAEQVGQRVTARATLAEIERWAQRGSLLDLGCWTGFLLADAADRGWRTTGVEPSEFASRFARERLGLDVVTSEVLEAELPQAPFDAIFLGDVIEHLPRPAEALDRIAELLADDGVLALTLPDAGSAVARLLGSRWWSVIPTHVHFFTRHSLETLLDRRGYELLVLRTAPKTFTVRYYLSRIGGYSDAFGRGIVRGAERLRLAERLWAPDFGDRMLAVARRRPARAGSSSPARPTISVVVPFLGDQIEARSLLDQLAALQRRTGDELIVADNTPTGTLKRLAGSGVVAVDASDRRSASHARNLGAAVSSSDWLLFIDADCAAPPDLLDRYFEPAPAARCGVVAGEIVGDPDQDAPLARWARSRRGRWVRELLGAGGRPVAVSANMLVRRAAFEQLGGFRLGGGGDFDLSWRLQDLGWGFEYRPGAVVLHRDRESLRALGEQARGYGSHLRHLRRVHGPAVSRVKLLRPLARSAAGAAAWLAKGDLERVRFKLFDGVHAVSAWWGQLAGPQRGRRAD